MTPAAGRVLADAPIAGFGHDTWWLVVIKVVGIFVFLVLTVLICIWAERRIVGRMQNRLGPNRVGPFGLLQSLADGIKLALKEDIIPDGADRIVFVLAPVVAAIPAFLAFAVVPFGPNVSIFGHRTQLQLTDMPVAVLYILAVASVGIYGIVLAGWSSGSTYPLLGGLRSSAQMISYEVAMGLALVGVFIYAGSMSTSSIVAHQHHLWFVVSPLFFSFCIYLVSMVGETNRAPFDLPEAEGELVGGFHTEYSSLKFAIFFLAEYVNMCTVSALATTMFFGGWRAPWPLSLWDGANQGWWPLLWFTVKLWIFLFFFIWLRGTLPRLRYDQFMRLGWKVLIPFSLFWLVAIAAGRAIGNNYTVDRSRVLLYGGIAVVVFIAILMIPTRTKEEPVDDSAQLEDFDPFAGGHPVPPMPWQERQVVRPAVGARTGEPDDE